MTRWRLPYSAWSVQNTVVPFLCFTFSCPVAIFKIQMHEMPLAVQECRKKLYQKTWEQSTDALNENLSLHLIEHHSIYTRPLTVKLIILKEENLECLVKTLDPTLKTQPGTVAKYAALGNPAGNRTRDLANLVQCPATKLRRPLLTFI